MSNDLRQPRDKALLIAQALISLLKPHCKRIEICGSLRREKPDVGDIDIVAIPSPTLLEHTDHLVSQGILSKAIYSDGHQR